MFGRLGIGIPGPNLPPMIGFLAISTGHRDVTSSLFVGHDGGPAPSVRPRTLVASCLETVCQALVRHEQTTSKRGIDACVQKLSIRGSRPSSDGVMERGRERYGKHPSVDSRISQRAISPLLCTHLLRADIISRPCPL